MRTEKGISVLALLITIIVIVIITSITIYSGVNIIQETRKKNASDKLSIICNALRKDDNFLGFDSGEILLIKEDYSGMDLMDYYDEEYPIYLTKSTNTTLEEIVTTYTLNMYKGDDRSSPYVNQSFTLKTELEKNIYHIDFDESKGINRPLLSKNMYALTIDGKSIVEDVYADEWYDYRSSVTSFAKMKFDSNNDGSIQDETITYVWIPRYAYLIQSFYNGANDPSRQHTKVPSSAIQIIFLREDTNYMINNEVIPIGYEIHPAFKTGGKDLAGIWVAVETSDDDAKLQDAMDTCSLITRVDENASSHLMTNTEYAAAIYLMFSLNDFQEINFTTQDEFVAAVLEEGYGSVDGVQYIDLYKKDTNTTTGVTLKTGDAMIETNWDRYRGDYPTQANPCIVRIFKSGYFDFKSVASNTSYHYRPVIINN